jgi:putative ABC transport system permease protein
VAQGVGGMSDVAVALSLVAVAVLVSRLQRLGMESEILVAAARAIVQLVAIAFLIDVVFEHLGFSGLLLGMMLVAASHTAGRRLKGVPSAPWIAATSIATSTLVVLVILFGAGVFPFEPRWLIAIAGMTIGNSMISVSLAGSRLRDELIDKAEEVEARLALGVRASDALKTYTRRAITNGMIPILDSTKNVGLILVPGAFVGMLLGGASPADAARVQLVVLFMLLGAVAVSAVTITALVARAFIGPGERVLLPGPKLEAR